MANAVTTVISDMLKTVDQTSEAFIETAYGGLGLQVEYPVPLHAHPLRGLVGLYDPGGTRQWQPD